MSVGRDAAHAAALLDEARRSVLGQPVAALLTAALAVAMTLGSVLTSGRAVAAEQAVLSAIDAEGTRSIVVRTNTGSSLMTGAVVAATSRVHEVEEVVGFGDAMPVQPAGAPRPRAPGLRDMVLPPGSDLVGSQLAGSASVGSAARLALASPRALAALGLADGTGAVRDDEGGEHTLVGGWEPPAAVTALEPLVVVPLTADGDGGPADHVPVTTLVVVARSPASVAVVEDAVRALVAADDPRALTVETSSQLAAVRQAVAGELGTYSRSTALAVIAGSALLVLVTQTALVLMRRRDFGRRRALGATRTTLVLLVQAQTALVTLAGALAGAVAGAAVLAAQHAPGPGLAYCAAVVVLALSASAIGTLPAAVLAATREPLVELRVP